MTNDRMKETERRQKRKRKMQKQMRQVKSLVMKVSGSRDGKRIRKRKRMSRMTGWCLQ